MVKDTPPTPAQTCGNCRHFEPARGEPAHDIRYGYCREHIAIERARNLLPIARLFDVGQPCVLVISPAGAPAHKPRVGA